MRDKKQGWARYGKWLGRRGSGTKSDWSEMEGVGEVMVRDQRPGPGPGVGCDALRGAFCCVTLANSISSARNSRLKSRLGARLLVCHTHQPTRHFCFAFLVLLHRHRVRLLRRYFLKCKVSVQERSSFVQTRKELCFFPQIRTADGRRPTPSVHTCYPPDTFSV